MQLLPAMLVAQTTDSLELLRLEAVWNRAHLEGDTVVLDSLWTADVQVTVPGMPVFSRADLLAFWRSGRSRITRYETSEVEVRVFGDSALVEGRLLRERDFNGRPVRDNWLFAKSYVRRASRWQVRRYLARAAGS